MSINNAYLNSNILKVEVIMDTFGMPSHWRISGVYCVSFEKIVVDMYVAY